MSVAYYANNKTNIISYSVIIIASLGAAGPAFAAGSCSISADSLTLTCSGTLSITAPATPTASNPPSSAPLPITIYDPASGTNQPIYGSNNYTPNNPNYASGYNPAPPTVTLNFTPAAAFNLVNPPATDFADKGLISANFSNTESAGGNGVNNVVLNNAGSLGFSTNQISTSRLELINSDSQVNSFTVNNTGTLSVAQTYFSTFNAASLTTATSGSPATVSAKYSGGTLNDMAALYSDDNTAGFTLNNQASGKVLATGNYATAYYGRADVTINNYGTIANTSYAAGDTVAAGHWAIATWAGTDYTPAPNTNPDSTIVLPNANGSVTVLDTSALTLTNNAGATIKGDILALDVTPLVYAAAVGPGTNPFANPGNSTLLTLPTSSSNAGPRDSNIENYGSITGNVYLGSGTHVIDNAAGALLTGSVYADQRPSEVVFSTPTPGTAAGTYLSAGGTDFNGNTCPVSGQNTTDAGCATTKKAQATVVGGQSFTLTNEGTLTGDIKIMDQANSVNSITLNGIGFTGNVVALNGTGSNSLTLNGVTNLASVQNFSSLDLTTSNVTVANGVSLVAGATLATTVSGSGGTLAAPNSTNTGSIYGTLTVQGATAVAPTFTVIAHDGQVFEIASAITGAGVNSVTAAPSTSALVNYNISTSSGALLLTTSVKAPSTIPNLSAAGHATLANLLSYSGSNANIQAIGTAVQALGSNAAVAAAGESLRPAVNGATIQTPLAVATLFQNQIDARLDSLFFGQVPVTGRSADLGTSRVNAPPAGPDNAAWANAIEGSASQGTVSNVAGYTARISGVIGGYDRVFAPGIRAGAAFGYAQTNVHDNTGVANSAGVQNYQGLIYAEISQPAWYLRGTGSYGGLNNNTRRTVSFAGFSDTAFGAFQGAIYTAGAELGVPLDYSGNIVVPYAGFTYAQIEQNAYTESSSAGAGLSYQRSAFQSGRAAIGAKSLIPIGDLPVIRTLGDSTSVIALELRGAYEHEFGDTAQSVIAGFRDSGSSFTATGPAASRDMLNFGAGFTFARANVLLSLSYNGVARANYLEQVGLFKARCLF